MTTLILGMDGMDKQIVEQNIEEFPNLAKLSINGLESVHPPITVPAWACSFAGCNPDKLERFDFQVIDFEDHEFRPVPTDPMETSGFWNYWEGEATLVDLPGAGVAEQEGYSIGGFMSGELSTYPKWLSEELHSNLGRVRVFNMSDYKSEKKRREKAYENFDIRKNVLNYMMENYGSDVYFIVYRLLDTMMHHCDSEEKMLEAYKEVDRYIGDILDRMDEKDNLFVLSDHGAVMAKQRFFVNTWLKQNGYLKQKEGHENSLIDNMVLKGADIAQMLGLRDLIVELNEYIKSSTGKSFSPRKSEAIKTINWAETEAFSYMTGVCAYAGIWINDERFAGGIVEDTEEVKERLKEDLEEREEVRNVHFREELYDKEVNTFPDIIIEFYEDTKSAFGFHPEVTTNVNTYMHRKEGLLMLKGHDIDRDVELKGAELIDLAPTVLHLHEEKVPDHMDGKVLDMFSDESEASKDVEEMAVEVSGIDI